MVVVYCNSCGNLLKRYPSQVNNANYCSYAHFLDCLSKDKNLRYSSESLKHMRQSHKRNFIDNKNHPFRNTNLNKKALENSIKSRKGKHLSESHKKKISLRMLGKNNPNYVDGSSPKNKLERGSAKYRNLVISVLKRDNYACQICNKTEKGLEVDHIMPKSLFEELKYDINNCRTLCKKCHIKYGAKPRSKIWAISPINLSAS